jgi:uncharacterized protein YjeT (DUF2065 family)
MFVGRLQHVASSGSLLNMKMFITLVGLVLILEGLPYVASPEAMQRWLKQLTEMSPDLLRMVGIFAMAAGFALCFLALKSGIFS